MNYMASSDVEKLWQLPEGTVRRDIHRARFSAKKAGNVWLVSSDMTSVYGPVRITRLWIVDSEYLGGVQWAFSENELATIRQNLGDAFGQPIDDEIWAEAVYKVDLGEDFHQGEFEKALHNAIDDGWGDTVIEDADDLEREIDNYMHLIPNYAQPLFRQFSEWLADHDEDGE